MPSSADRSLRVALPRGDASAVPDVDEMFGVCAHAKEQMLARWLCERGSVLVGFSGGVDSAYLAVFATTTLGSARVLAVIGRSPSFPEAQWEIARDVARRFAIPVEEVDTHELADERYAQNPVNRCYFCKDVLWQTLAPIAAERGLAAIVDGTNADDLRDYRPGGMAARERGVSSPLAEVGLTKEEIRWLSRRRDIPTWSRPSSPCLSSRVPYGTPVTIERLRRIERAEEALRALGVAGDLRVRDHDELARVEMGEQELQRWLEPTRAARLREVVRAAGFSRVALDLRGFRSGSLNVLSGVTGD